MNETKQIKFPIAAVFCTLNVLLGFINIFMTYALLPRMPLDRLLVSLLLPGLSLISGIVLAVILYTESGICHFFLPWVWNWQYVFSASTAPCLSSPS